MSEMELSVLAAAHFAEAERLSRPVRFARGLIPPEELDDEEVWRQEIRDDDGTFYSDRWPGNPEKKKVPRALVNEKQRRILSDGTEIFQNAFKDALEAVASIARNPDNAASDRLRAADMIIQRVAGKVPDRIHIAADDPVEKLFTTLLTSPGALEEDQHGIVDADVVEG